MKLDATALEAHPLPPIRNDDDKDSKGSILVIAGSRQVPGAAVLSATAAMRAGAGKLRIATVESASLQLGLHLPEAMVVGLPEDNDGGFADAAVEALAQQLEETDAIVAGPGVRPNAACGAIAEALLKTCSSLALDVAFLKALNPPTAAREIAPVLLPDSDELASMLDCEEQEIERDPVGCGLRAAEAYRSIVLVKGPPSHVVCPDGKVWTHGGGAPGLGVSGSGDVLAGIVGGLLARGAEPLNALLWAVWLHQEAGAALSKKVGPLGFLARQIADEIPALLPR
ncbi:MAG: NAD(P)H-hydrate dehydratase [Sphingomonas sp.]|nr:NAD(P)H-hydrate dehydratase [Sphingomonas sp.]MBW0006975.1 NAD(P)H-hydrate dehydratase [Sphingomonas sp.]